MCLTFSYHTIDNHLNLESFIGHVYLHEVSCMRDIFFLYAEESLIFVTLEYIVCSL
jgi:hypothetical protein